MRYSLEPKYRRYVRGYGFLSFGKKLMNTATKTGINAAKTFGDKYSKNLIYTVKKQD